MKNKSVLWLVIVIAAVVALFLYPKFKSGGLATGKTSVPCLVPNLPIIQHIHPTLAIEVDGKEEFLPDDIGRRGCERAIHTHDEKGVIHVEAQDSREYTLGDFFSVWGKTLTREGYALSATVDGQFVPLENLSGLVLRDQQAIVLDYEKILVE